MKTNLYVEFQEQEPVFFTLHRFIKDAPGDTMVPSGIVTSATYSALLHATIFPDPGGGAVGGALVVSGVGESRGVIVAFTLVAVGVNAARSVSCAATVCA